MDCLLIKFQVSCHSSTSSWSRSASWRFPFHGRAGSSLKLSKPVLCQKCQKYLSVINWPTACVVSLLLCNKKLNRITSKTDYISSFSPPESFLPLNVTFYNRSTENMHLWDIKSCIRITTFIHHSLFWLARGSDGPPSLGLNYIPYLWRSQAA